MIQYLRRSAGLIGLLAVIASAGLFMTRDAGAQTFFVPCSISQLTSSAANAPSDIKTTFGIGLNDACEPFTSAAVNQWNSAGLIYFTPAEWHVAKDADIPDGTKVGSFSSKAVLGLLNNTCHTVLPVNFDLFDGTINRNGPKVDEKPEGQPDRLAPMRDNVPQDGIPDAALAWPSYLDAVADKAGMDLSKLVARFVGVNVTAVAQTSVVLNFLIFQPGAKVSDKIVLDPRLGYPAVTILQDPSTSASPQDPVSDFCAPLWTEGSLFGTAGGATFRGNPPDGTYDLVTYVNPAPDADNDGIENALDPCPVTPNASGFDPRAQTPVQNPGDQDGDGMPDDCDPHPTTKSGCNARTGISNTDEDCDGWQNRGDNCPLVKNEDQADDDGDGIGDACDTGTTNGITLHVSETDGQNLPVCKVTQVTIGAGGAAPVDPQTLAPCNPQAGVPTATPVPTITPVGQTPSPTPAGGGGGGGGVGGGGNTGIGTLAPTSDSAPLWATMLAALGIIGLVIGFGMMGSRFLRRRD
jgi:hypothetical protein